MKLKKILCSALTVAIVFAAIVAFLPAKQVSAANSPSVSQASAYTPEQIKTDILEAKDGVYNYKFNNAQEMLEYELSKGYLDSVSSPGKLYSLYINRYSGYAYYVNNTTGEILTSNPYNIGSIGSTEVRKKLSSQISVTFTEITNQVAQKTFTSAVDSAERGQISITPIANGLRVNYTLGDTSTRLALPEQVSAESFESQFIKALSDRIAAILEDATILEYYPGDDGDEYFQVDFFENEDYPSKDSNSLEEFLFMINDNIGNANVSNKVINSFKNEMSFCMVFIGSYNKNGDVYTLSTAAPQSVAKSIKTLFPDYSIGDAYDHEEEVGYVYKVDQRPIFRCSLEYTFNNDGSLSVRLPASSIVFDETVYILQSITPLETFGCGDVTTDGYIFIPDGSGSVILFEDFYSSGKTTSVNLMLDIYGTDYSYSSILGAHKEQVTMPVYGVVSGVNAGSDTQAIAGNSRISGGFFAILEEGASLAQLTANITPAHKYASVFSSFTPYPSDKFELAGDVAVGGTTSYTMVSDSKYTGSYVTRYVMLSDATVNAACGNLFTESSYTGMAEYYRNYLNDIGVIEELSQVYEDLPLYIEVLGSMEVVEKFLTFPVTRDKALTTFDDVITMYNEFSNAKQRLLDKAAEAEARAEEIDDDLDLRQFYLDEAAQYRDNAEKISNIININFKLTGFANGGMYYTYPTKVKWDKVVGGKDGFNNLVSVAAGKTEGDNVFGVYPDFDFQYINNTKAFDGISKRGNVSRQVDNRYASKQEYNTVLAEYESIFAMVISPDALNKLYNKFDKKFSQFGCTGISVSTLGSDLNSNFDEDNPINREQARESVVALLDRIKNDQGYNVMMNKGNIYAVEFADHIIDICTDSSHFNYASYTVPFVGMVLHGYVNYSGGAMNYSGSPDYELLRAIENGASLYYILCYDNTNYMKDDEVLSKYYGVNYENWYDSIVSTYSELNRAIGDLQQYSIVAHRTLIAERVLDDDEVLQNNTLIADEFLNQVELQLRAAVNAAYDEMYDDTQNYGRGVKVTLITDALTVIAMDKLNLTQEELEEVGFVSKLAEIKARYETEYPGIGADEKLPYEVIFDSVSYESEYEYVTDSCATDENYDYTSYTVDNNQVVMVTYRNAEGDSVSFILNYNIYRVTVRLDSDSEPIVLEKNGYYKLTKEG